MIFALTFMFLSVALIAWAWVRGIDDMKENHPDYKGEDFLELPDKKPFPEEEWDNNHHNEDV